MSNEIVTFGCRLNTYESEVMRAHADAAGLDGAIIFNTCAVTAEAERQARQAIRRARKENPDAKIIVTGCSAQVHAKMYEEMPEVDQVLGNEEKLTAGSWQFADKGERVRVNDIMSVKETAAHLVQGFEGRARAFVQVQNGCDHRCTFCIIPYGRGNSRSVPMGEIVSQVRELVANGYKEVVITGVDITSYGADLPGQPTLGQMMRRLLAQVPELPRLRISSIDAIEVDADLMRLIENEPRLMPHIHLSLQSGDDMILKRMKRRHSRAQALEFCGELRRIRPDIVLGADIIAGFPTETEEMFENTCRFVEEAGLTYLHVFPYSARTGTPAARMPQVEKNVRKERAARLRSAGGIQLERFLVSQIGKVREVLFEDAISGKTEHYAPVDIPEAKAQGGIITKVEITGVSGTSLEARLIQ